MKLRLTNKIDWSHEFEVRNETEFFSRLNVAFLDFQQNCRRRGRGPVIHVFVESWGKCGTRGWVDIGVHGEVILLNPLTRECKKPLWDHICQQHDKSDDFAQQLGGLFQNVLEEILPPAEETRILSVVPQPEPEDDPC
ncbi:MAG: hypothetical protein M1438_09620 [Deltaproteobacteria bacterium]|nr:hypothetical protein [Deltaproteobacteria bacterium]